MFGAAEISSKGADVIVMETAEPFGEFPQMDDIDAVLQRERSPLLSLPPELLQNILYHMDASTCFVSLLSCTTIFEATQSKRVLLRHLNRMPGLKLGLDSELAALTLFESFRRRAAKQLTAAGILANVARYAPCDDITKITKSAFSPGKPVLMATAHSHGQVRIYELSERYLRLKAELQTDPGFDEELNRDYHMEILRLEFSPDKDLAVLCRPKSARVKGSPIFEDSTTEDKDARSILKLVGSISLLHYTKS